MYKAYVLYSRFIDLEGLQHLAIGGNDFKDVPAVVYSLNELRVLDLSYSNKLLSVNEKVLNLKNLKTLNLWRCSSLTHPPSSVCEKGLHAVKKHFTDFKSSMAEAPAPLLTRSQSGNFLQNFNLKLIINLNFLQDDLSNQFALLLAVPSVGVDLLSSTLNSNSQFHVCTIESSSDQLMFRF